MNNTAVLVDENNKLIGTTLAMQDVYVCHMITQPTLPGKRSNNTPSQVGQTTSDAISAAIVVFSSHQSLATLNHIKTPLILATKLLRVSTPRSDFCREGTFRMTPSPPGPRMPLGPKNASVFSSNSNLACIHTKSA